MPGTLDPNYVPYGPMRIDPNALKAGHIQQWNGGVEFELNRDTRLGIQYMGNKGSRLQNDQFEPNQPADLQAVTRLQFRMELFNVFNRHYFFGPDMNPGGASFGHVYNAAGPQHIGQLDKALGSSGKSCVCQVLNRFTQILPNEDSSSRAIRD